MQGGEPTLEQILASIKRVMVRGDAPSPQAGPDHEPELEAHSEHPPVAEAVDPANAEEASEVLELAPDEMPGGAAADETQDHGATPLPSGQPFRTGLAQSDAAAAVRQSLAALELLSQGDAPPPPQLPADAALDALTRALLRPMLAEWLDANLPRIVEQQVQAEIARIVGR